jgi:hypothetical protein
VGALRRNGRNGTPADGTAGSSISAGVALPINPPLGREGKSDHDPTRAANTATHDVAVGLTEVQSEWLKETAAEQSPPQSAVELLRTIVDQAMMQSEATEERRSRQFEIFHASGYSEHHPDYPSFSGGL